MATTRDDPPREEPDRKPMKEEQPVPSSEQTILTAAAIQQSTSPPDNLNSTTLFPPPNARLAITPTYGQHRPNITTAIFSFARGFELSDYLPFISSLHHNTNFQGDLVLGVSNDLDNELRAFFQHVATRYAVIVYEIPLSCIKAKKIRTHCQTVGMFVDADTDGAVALPDLLGHREVAQLRFEYYWAWSTMYHAASTDIWLLDARDVYFQDDFSSQLLSTNNNMLHVFEESSITPIWKQRSNRRWIKAAYGEEIFREMKYKTVVCSGSTVGPQPMIQEYTARMVQQFVETNCTVYGCDQGHHNYLTRLVYTNDDSSSSSSRRIQVYEQGEGLVNTLGLLVTEKGNLTDLHLLDQEGRVLNNDKSTISPILHQYDRDVGLRARMDRMKQDLLRKWRSSKTI